SARATFCLQGQLDLFATRILDFLRGDSRPQLIDRVDSLLDLLARVPKACDALAPPPSTGRRQCCRSRMLVQRKSGQVHRNDTVGGCGRGGGVKAPRFAHVESGWRTLARRRGGERQVPMALTWRPDKSAWRG